MQASKALPTSRAPFGPYKLLSWGHFVAGFYRAHQRSPGSPYVKATLQRGLVGCVIFQDTLPSDVERWAINLHNEFHTGSARSYIEDLQFILIIEGEWKIFMVKSKISSRDGHGDTSYEKVYWKFIENTYPGRIRSWNWFKDLSSTAPVKKPKPSKPKLC